MSDELDQRDEEESGKGKPKLLLIVGLANIVLILGVLGYFIFSYEGGSSASEVVAEESLNVADVESVESSEDEVVSEEEAQEVGEDGEAVEPQVSLSDVPVYVSVGPILSNLNSPDRYEYIQLSLTVKTYNLDLESVLASHEIVLKNIVQYEVREMSELELLSNEGIKKLTKNIRLKLNTFLKELDVDIEYVEEFLLSDVIIE